MALEKFTDNFKDNLKKKAEQRRMEQGVKRKDKDAFMQAYDNYVDDIYRFIYFKVGSADEAGDITSQVFLKTWNYIQEDKLESISTLRALIYKIARNCIIDHYRSIKTDKVNIDDENAPVELEDTKQDVGRQAEINSDMEEVRRNLDKLKDEYKEILILRYINELSFKEIAKITGKSKSNVRVLSHRALNALRELMR